MTAAEGMPAVVLISGNGSNLQTFIDEQAAGRLPLDIRAVVSNRADAFGLERASRADIPTEVLPSRGYADRDAYDAALEAVLTRHRPRLLVLAGFMRILGTAFVSRHEGQLVNIHPSLLPAFRGLHTHQRVLEAGASCRFRAARRLPSGQDGDHSQLVPVVSSASSMWAARQP